MFCPAYNSVCQGSHCSGLLLLCVNLFGRLYVSIIVFIIYSFKAGHVASNRPEVNIADQIAIRSLVLSKNLGKVGGQQGMLYL